MFDHDLGLRHSERSRIIGGGVGAAGDSAGAFLGLPVVEYREAVGVLEVGGDTQIAVAFR